LAQNANSLCRPSFVVARLVTPASERPVAPFYAFSAFRGFHAFEMFDNFQEFDSTVLFDKSFQLCGDGIEIVLGHLRKTLSLTNFLSGYSV